MSAWIETRAVACTSCGRVAAGRKKNDGGIAIFGAKGSVCTEYGNDEFSVLD